MEIFIAVIRYYISIEFLLSCQLASTYINCNYLMQVDLDLDSDFILTQYTGRNFTHQKHSVVCQILADRACSWPRNYFLSLNRQPEQSQVT